MDSRKHRKQWFAGAFEGDGCIGRFCVPLSGDGNPTVAPVLLKKVEPEYSEEAGTGLIDVSVMLLIVVNVEGKAEQMGVVRSLGHGLDEAATDAVSKWGFRPAGKNGSPVEVIAQVEVNFRLL